MLAELYLTLCDPMDYSLPGTFVPGIYPGKNIGMSFIFLLWRIFLTQDRTHISCISCIGRQILYRQATWEAPMF